MLSSMEIEIEFQPTLLGAFEIQLELKVCSDILPYNVFLHRTSREIQIIGMNQLYAQSRKSRCIYKVLTESGVGKMAEKC